MSKPLILGLVEQVTLIGSKGEKAFLAKIDTGATKSSIDESIVQELGLGPVVESRLVRTAHGSRLRPVIEVEVELLGKAFRTKFTVADRSELKYQVLIGVNILKMGFLIDPLKYNH